MPHVQRDAVGRAAPPPPRPLERDRGAGRVHHRQRHLPGPGRRGRAAPRSRAGRCWPGSSAGLVALFGALTYAELAAALPRSGGVFAYILEGFGPLPAFLFGWSELTVIRASALGAIATIFAEYLGYFIQLDAGAGALGGGRGGRSSIGLAQLPRGEQRRAC